MNDALFNADELPPEEAEKQPGNDVPFETALEQLEQLVERMENGKVPLEQLISDFETGSKLVKRCRAKLEKLERKIELLTRDDGNQGQWEDFDRVPQQPER